MRLAFAIGGRTDTALTSKEYTFQQLAARLRVPRAGQKDGSYYIRGGDLEAPKRADGNLRSAELLIIDGDSRIDPETGEIISGAPPMPAACEALRQMGLAFIAHTSHSYKPVNGGGLPHWKYRVVIPAKIPDQKTLDACVSYVLAQLHQRGVWIADVNENRKWSQPWYLPRVSTVTPEAFMSDVNEDGGLFPVEAAVQWQAQKDARDATERSLEQATPGPASLSPDTNSVIEAFNEAHGLDWVRAQLEQRGYRFAYKDGDKLRYIRPGSESGTAGVVVFRGAKGDWCVFSHHGAADPLSGRMCDPFDLVAVFQHGGDRKAAAKALKPPSVTEQLFQRKAQHDRPAQPGEPVEPGDGMAGLESDLDEFGLPAPARAEGDAPQAYRVASATHTDPGKKVVELVPWAGLKDVKVRWLVKDMIPAQSFTAIYGKSGAGKSFFAMYLAAMIASGREAFGADVEQGAVVYLALEGGSGLRRRRDALMKVYGLPGDLPVHFVRSQMNLRSTLDDLTALVDAINAAQIKPSVIFIDTLARAFAGGEENSSSEMMQFVSVLAALQEALGCAVCVVHHSGKDETRGMRGSSALLAAVDAELELTRAPGEGEEPLCTVRSTKQKDGVDSLTWSFRLQLVQTSAIDPDATSLAVVPLGGEGAAGARRNRTSPNRDLVMEALEEAISKQGQIVGLPEIPAGKKVVKTTTWRSYFDLVTHLEGDNARRTWERAVKQLHGDGKVNMHAKWCWISEG